MIFLVDDDPIQNMLTSQILESTVEGVDYLVFNNGKEVLDSLEEGNTPEVILLDINMPLMDGWEFLNNYELYKEKAKVFMLTSSIHKDDMVKSSEFECIKGYYPKPIDKTVMKEILIKAGYS